MAQNIMKYIWMLTDTPSDGEPPELFSSKRRGVQRMEELFEETLDDFVKELTEEEKNKYREQFKKDGKTYFNLFEEISEGYRKKLLWIRTCSLTKEYVK